MKKQYWKYNIKRVFCMLMAVLMLVGIVPQEVFASENSTHDNQVHVIVENTTYTTEEGAPWDGTLVDTWVEIDETSTMMGALVSALDSMGATQSGAEYNYVSDINGLSASGYAGWMGTLNDWFTSEGFGYYNVADGTLQAGDEIRIMYTEDMGEDLGGSWNNNDTTLKAISFSAGTLEPGFSAENYEYVLTVPKDTKGIFVTPTATNKNFQVQTSVNGTVYKRTAEIPVEDGTEIIVECGNPDWPSMNKWGTTPSYTSHIYKFKVAYEETKQQEKLSSLMIHTGSSTPKKGSVIVDGKESSYVPSVEFEPDVLQYTLPAMADSTTSLKFRSSVLSGDGTATLYYQKNGVEQTKNILSSSKSISVSCLSPGKNNFKIVAASKDTSVNATTYQFVMDILPTITSLDVTCDLGQLYLDQTFSSGKQEYELNIPSGLEQITISATPKSENYKITYNGQDTNTIDIGSQEKVDVVVSVGEGENKVENTYTLKLNRKDKLEFKVQTTPEDAIVQVYDHKGNIVAANEDGSYSGMFGTYDYTYTVSKYGYVGKSGVVPANGGTINVSLDKVSDNQLKDVGAYWGSFRGNNTNMAITNVRLPQNEDVDSITLKWNKKIGSGWSAAPSVQIIVDNALITMVNKNIYKLDLQTGEILKEGTMSAAPNFGYTPPVYAEGMIICPLSNGTIQAFNAETLESVWIYKDSIGGQSLSPITYSDGYIYTGFWKGENKNANFVCISVTDEDVNKTDENKQAVWKHTQTGGFYWAGAVVIGDAVIVGTDDGESGSTGTGSKIYSFNKYTGEIISSMNLTGDQRSSIAYDSETGRIYFTTKAGYLYRADVDTKTGVLSNLKGQCYNAQTTSTPIVYKGRVYFGTGSGISSSGSSGNFVVADAESLEMLFAIPMKGYPQCSFLMTNAYEAQTGYLYFYGTYNAYPGGITAIKVKADCKNAEDAEITELYTPADGLQQYCVSSIICSSDGTLYYKNDSCNILAVGVPSVVNVQKFINEIGTVTLKSGSAIQSAREAYDALSEEDKEKISNYETLVAAEKVYQEFVNADAVDQKINAIGTVTLNSASVITVAREAYNALSESEKEKVTKYEVLAEAEETYEKLVKDAEAEREKVTNEKEETTTSKEEVIDEKEEITTPSVKNIVSEVVTTTKKIDQKKKEEKTEKDKKEEVIDKKEETADFSYQGVVGYQNLSPMEKLREEESTNMSWVPWAIAGGSALIVLAVLAALLLKNRKSRIDGDE